VIIAAFTEAKVGFPLCCDKKEVVLKFAGAFFQSIRDHLQDYVATQHRKP
jgi:hypothetical protein